MTTMTREQAATILRHTANSIVETVNEMGDRGAPAGPMYAALMERGMSHDMFEQIMSALVGAGKVRKRGDCYFPALAQGAAA